MEIVAALHLALMALLAGWLIRERQARRRQNADFSLIAARDRAQAAKMAAILKGMPDGIVVLDKDIRLVEWNDHFPEFAGVPSGMLRVGMDFSDVLRVQAAAGEFGSVDVDAEVERRMALLRSGGSTGVIERSRPNGNTLELRRNPLPEGGFVTLYTDISAQHQAEIQLRQAQKMEAVGHLTGGVALAILDKRSDIVLLFTDIELPGANGPELVEEALSQRPGLPVLYTTGYQDNAVVHRGILAREVTSLTKPFTVGDMAHTVRETIDGAILEDSLHKESE